MIRAVNGKVIIKRDEVIDNLDGMFVSDGATVKSYYGEVVASGDGSVSIGDRVLLPNYRTDEMKYEGVEYAVCKADELLCVEVDGEWKPLNDFVKTLKCVTDHYRNDDGEVLVYLPDNLHNASSFVEILDIGPDCVFMRDEHIGRFTEAPERSVKLQRIPYTDEFLLREDMIRFVV